MWRLVIIAWLLGLASAQTIAARELYGQLYLALDELALTLGFSHSREPGSLTVRTPRGVLTVFAGSPDIIYQGLEQSLSAPVVVEGGWFAPLELYALLGFSLSGGVLRAGGRELALVLAPAPPVVRGSGYERVELGNAVWGLAFFARDRAGEEAVSVLVADLALLSLVYPDKQRQLDAIMARFSDSRPLYFVASALLASDWQPVFTVAQGNRQLELRYPSSVRLLEGSAERLEPDRPAIGVIELPSWVNLHQPLTLSWGGVSATVQFRR